MVRWRGQLGKANIRMFRLANCWSHIYGLAFLLLVVFGNGDIWPKMYNLLDEEACEKSLRGIQGVRKEGM